MRYWTAEFSRKRQPKPDANTDAACQLTGKSAAVLPDSEGLSNEAAPEGIARPSLVEVPGAVDPRGIRGIEACEERPWDENEDDSKLSDQRRETPGLVALTNCQGVSCGG